jgi:class 3 adenylate cyclase
MRLALAMRDRIATLVAKWRRDGHDLGFGIGIARGEAILGGVGFEHKVEYSVIGAVPNLASRLCDTARDGQILLCGSAYSAAKASFDAQALGELSLRGFRRPVPVYDLRGALLRQVA